MWTCAAALEPVPPTWLGMSWRKLLAMPVDLAAGAMTVRVATRYTAHYRTKLERECMIEAITCTLDQHAILILERHGLQPIPIDYTQGLPGEDDIPF